MKTALRIFSVALLCVASSKAVAGSSVPCGPQAFRHLDDVEPNEVALDPVSGQRLLLQVVRARTGTTVTINGRACDEDGDALTVWADTTGNQLPLDANGQFSFQVSGSEAGTQYVTVGVTDGIATRLGTYAAVFQDNSPPVLSALPPDGGSTVARLRQKMLMTWHKYTGKPLRRGLVLVRGELARETTVSR